MPWEDQMGHILNMFLPINYSSFLFILLYIFLRFIENLNKFNFLLKLKNIILFSLLVIFLFSLNLNIKNILDYPDRFNEYIKLPDQKFLNER